MSVGDIGRVPDLVRMKRPARGRRNVGWPVGMNRLARSIRRRSRSPMPTRVRRAGPDGHAETIAVADGRVRGLGTTRNLPEAVRELMAKLGRPAGLRVYYEAGPTGYPLYCQFTAMGLRCAVIAPSLIPTKAGDGIKTDRNDTVGPARCYCAGDLAVVCVPDTATRALPTVAVCRAGEAHGLYGAGGSSCQASSEIPYSWAYVIP